MTDTVLQYLSPEGQVTRELPTWTDNSDTLVRLYKIMVLTRLFDQKAVSLQRTGQLGTYASCLGQEAIGIGCALAMEKRDVFIPYYRDQSAQIQRGVTLTELLLYWGGDERGSDYRHCREDFPICVPIATQCLHACGVASAFKIRAEDRVAVVTCGDGATSKGDFLEALNLAGVWQLPVVFVINNNHWAISTPRALQSSVPRLADKALAAGFAGVQVDGNDAIAVHQAMRQAIAKARQHKGPTLVECLTYRLGDHTTADDASRYRSSEELKKAWEKEPVKRLQHFLNTRGLWQEDNEQALIKACQTHIQQAVDQYLGIEPEPPEAMFRSLYAHLPADIKQQMAQAEEINRRG